MQEFTKLNDLCNKISTFENIDTYICDDERGGKYIKTREYKDEYSSVEYELLVPEELLEHLTALEAELCGLFISNSGQHSRAYYQAIKNGVKLKVVERDSFGPLIVQFTSPDDKWSICYG